MASTTNNNVRPARRDNPAWDSANPASAVQSVYQRVEDHATGVIDWYLKAKHSKRIFARAYRTGALILDGMAGLLPMFAQMHLGASVNPDSHWAILLPLVEQPAWASVFLGLAALLVLLDRFFGCSTAWMRFITTEHQVRQALHEFQIDCDIEQASWQGGQPDAGQVQAALQRCKAFVVKVDDMVRAETDRWVSEFQDAIKQVDEMAKARAALAETGAVNVSVTNGDRAEGGWHLSVDGSPPTTHSGTQATLGALTPGLHTITVSGTVDGKPRSASKAVTVLAGKAAEVPFTF
ncbi:MAG TPA: SLATT domain-containing protein [Burkholderiales bacterium]